ncbi:MAG: hypothetical protein FD180_4740 [Planctomycetota bacterium]|nr:MAG: hypothetical protein FD180_4740 [Planctomycetota bacterium]
MSGKGSGLLRQGFFLALFGLTSLLPGCVSTPMAVCGLSRPDLHYCPDGVVQYYGEQEVRLAPDIVATAAIEVTTKGNGLLRITSAGRDLIAINIYDEHSEADEYCVFENGMLAYSFADSNGDGLLDIEVTGVIVTMEEERIISKRTVKDSYLYDSAKGRFVLSQ